MLEKFVLNLQSNWITRVDYIWIAAFYVHSGCTIIHEMLHKMLLQNSTESDKIDHNLKPHISTFFRTKWWIFHWTEFNFSLSLFLCVNIYIFRIDVSHDNSWFKASTSHNSNINIHQQLNHCHRHVCCIWLAHLPSSIYAIQIDSWLRFDLI